jgi:hypothetical protein
MRNNAADGGSRLFPFRHIPRAIDTAIIDPSFFLFNHPAFFFKLHWHVCFSSPRFRIPQPTSFSQTDLQYHLTKGYVFFGSHD